METLRESGLLDGAEDRDGQILEQLALSTYEMRRRFPSDADYDWYQAERELGMVELVKALAQTTAAFGQGQLDRDASAISDTFSRLRRKAQAILEPYDDRLCSELVEALEHAEQSLVDADGKGRVQAREPFFRRFRWRS